LAVQQLCFFVAQDYVILKTGSVLTSWDEAKHTVALPCVRSALECRFLPPSLSSISPYLVSRFWPLHFSSTAFPEHEDTEALALTMHEINTVKPAPQTAKAKARAAGAA
jgi:hypothetical protein